MSNTLLLGVFPALEILFNVSLLFFLQTSKCGLKKKKGLQQVNGKFNNVHTFPAAVAAVSAMCLKNHQSQNQWNKLLQRYNTCFIIKRSDLAVEA